MTDSEPPSFSSAARKTAANTTADSWERMRTLALGGAGACTALLLFVLQDAELRQQAQTALFLACAGAPLLLASSAMTENFLVHGQASYADLKSPAAYWVMSAAFLLGGTSLIASLFLLIRAFFPWTASVFLFLSLVAAVVCK